MTTIINLTPHQIQITAATPPAGEPPSTWTLPPSGAIARAIEATMPADPIDGIPTVRTEYVDLEHLPRPAPDTYLVVSLVVAQVAERRGRPTHDLLVPGEQIRDAAGKVIGCRSLMRVGPRYTTYDWRTQREAFVSAALAAGGSSDVGGEGEPVHLGRYARNYCLPHPRPGMQARFYLGTRRGPNVAITGVPFGTLEEMAAAYALLASAGAICNDASDGERQLAADALAARS